MVYLKSVENVITLGKLIGLLFSSIYICCRYVVCLSYVKLTA